MKWVVALGALLWALGPWGTARAHGSFLVNTTEDHDDGACEPVSEGDCTLREAITAANALLNDHPDSPDAIGFDFGPGATAPFTIAIGAPLPTIIEGTIIDGASEPRYILSEQKVPVVVLEGEGVDHLLRVRSDSTLIVSLGFDGAAVSAIDAENADYLLVRGCYFGVDTETGEPTGIGLPSFGAHAIHVRDTLRARIGGLDVLSRNVVAGAGAEAILIERTDDLLLHGNYVGVDPTGTAPRPNGLTSPIAYAVEVRASSGVEVVDNVVSSNLGPGIALHDTPEAVFEGNRIGTNPDGRDALGNGGTGLSLSGNIDGLFVRANVVSSNDGDGVRCEGPNEGQWVMLGTMIGVDLGQSQALSNSGDGVSIAAACNGAAIGATSVGQGNVIGHNGRSGIRLADGEASARGNSVFLNGDLGIDAAGEGVTGNDVDDIEMPINFPEVVEVEELDGALEISGCTRGGAKVDVYEASPDPSGFGEGKRYLGSVVEGGASDGDSTTGCSPVNDSGFSFVLETDATRVTLTATYRDDTSEFSAVYPESAGEPDPGCDADAACAPPAPLCNLALRECQVCIDDADHPEVDSGCTSIEPKCLSMASGARRCATDPDADAPDPPLATGGSQGCTVRGSGDARGGPSDALLILMAVSLLRRRKKLSSKHINT